MSTGLSYADQVQRERDRRRRRKSNFSDLAPSAATNLETFTLEEFLPATLDVEDEETATYGHPEPFEVTSGGIVRVTLRCSLQWVTLASGLWTTTFDLIRTNAAGGQVVVDSFVIGCSLVGIFREDHCFLAADETPGEGTYRYSVRWTIEKSGSPTGTVTPILQSVHPVEYRQGPR